MTCTFCGNEVRISDTVITIDDPNEVDLETAKKLRKLYLEQQNEKGVRDCCKIIVRHDKKDWKTWFWLALNPGSFNDFRICLDNAIEHCDDETSRSELLQIKNEYALVTLQAAEYSFNIRGKDLTVCLFPIMDDIMVQDRAGVVTDPPFAHDMTLLLPKGRYDFYFVPERKRTIDIRENTGICPERGPQIYTDVFTEPDINVPYPTVFKVDPDKKIEESYSFRKIRVFVDERLTGLNLLANGKPPLFLADGGKIYFETISHVYIVNRTGCDGLDSDIEINTCSDIVLTAEEEKVAAEGPETVQGVRYRFSYEELEPDIPSEDCF